MFKTIENQSTLSYVGDQIRECIKEQIAYVLDTFKKLGKLKNYDQTDNVLMYKHMSKPLRGPIPSDLSITFYSFSNCTYGLSDDEFIEIEVEINDADKIYFRINGNVNGKDYSKTVYFINLTTGVYRGDYCNFIAWKALSKQLMALNYYPLVEYPSRVS